MKKVKKQTGYDIPVLAGWIAFLLTLVIVGYVGYFIALPAISVHSIGFWLWLLLSIGCATFVGMIVDSVKADNMTKETTQKYDIPKSSSAVVGVFIAILTILVLVIGSIASARLFCPQKYANRITVEESTFIKEIPAVDDINKIALMDTDTARIIGKRAMGSLTEMVSQYQVSDAYSTIDYCGMPRKVAPLEYAGFIKYMNNKSLGIPGYVLVDPVNNTAEYVSCQQPIYYSPSGFFTHDLLRHIRSKYKTEVFEGHYFEIDDQGVPYWVCPVLSYGSFMGASMIESVVIVNACDGSMSKYMVADVPNWVDRVYDGDLLCEAYDDYGALSQGFWNSVFSKKGCKMTTDDYGYKVMDGDVWVYTGVTSMANDESNIGFVLMNQRTAQCIYFSLPGAEEYSAMGAAEGALQDLGYYASFPSLVNIDSVPTYICALKDNGGLVKQYAMIHVEQYNLVATGSTPLDAIKAYRQLLEKNNLGIEPGINNETLEKQIVIASIDYIVIDGDTVVYLTSEEGEVFKQRFADEETLIFLKQGDRIKVTYERSDASEINRMEDFAICK